MQMLLERGAHADGKGTNAARPKVTPLMLACMSGDAQCAYALIKHGATLNAADPEGFAPLHHAWYAGHVECVKILLAAQADRTRRCGGKTTALEIAQNQGHAACAAAFDDDRLQLPVTMLSNGSLVRIVGLVAKSEHNGKLAEVTTFNADSGRYTVSLRDMHSGLLNVKPQNVVVAEEEAEPWKPPSVRQCAVCGTEERAAKFMRCGQCVDLHRVDAPFYCGRDCQKVDWKRGHRAFHKELAQADDVLTMQSGELEATREGLATAVLDDEFDSSYDSVMNSALDIFMNQRDPKRATKVLRKAIAQDPARDRGYSLLGLVLQQQRQFPEALLEYGKAIARLLPGGEEWARITLQQLSCLATTGGKWIRPRSECRDVAPEWFHHPHEQIKLAVKCCIAVPDNAQAWHWRASMLAFLSRQSTEAARCWRRGAECSDADSRFREDMLQWAHQTEAGIGEPPFPGMWEDDFAATEEDVETRERLSRAR